MGRIIYTERDIEDLAKRGVTEIPLDENVTVTDLAREKMDQLGIRALTGPAARPAALAPAAAAPSAAPARLSESERQQVMEKVKSGVIARLGPGVDVALIDAVVRRVVNQL